MNSTLGLDFRKTTLIVAGASLILTTLFHIWKNSVKRTFVTNAARVITLYIYPIKSISGVAVKKLTICKDGGVRFNNLRDRSMMLITSAKKMITVVTDPRLSLIATTLVSHGDDRYSLKLTAQEMNDPLHVSITDDDITENSKKVVHEFDILGTLGQGIEVSKEASKWFSTYLKKEVLLVKHIPSLKKRQTLVINSTGDNLVFNPKKEIEFQNDAPLMLTNKKSLEALNSSIPKDCNITPFDDRNFRPNVVIDEIECNKEYDFAYIRFQGDIICKNSKICQRCPSIAVNQDKGLMEGSRTDVAKKFLSTEQDAKLIKMFGKKPVFGVKFFAEADGDIQVGSWIDVSFK